jgi:hypothetical protein
MMLTSLYSGTSLNEFYIWYACHSWDKKLVTAVDRNVYEISFLFIVSLSSIPHFAPLPGSLMIKPKPLLV